MPTGVLDRAAAFAAVLLLSWNVGTAGAETLNTWGVGHKLVRHSSQKLSRKQRDALSAFRRNGGYFGAMAVHPNGEDLFWFKNMHGLNDARQFALGGCRQLAKTGGRDPDGCVLYASMIPRNMDPRTRDAEGIGERAYRVFAGRYPKAQTAGRYGAFAVSGIFDWAYSTNSPNEAEARGSATARCRAEAGRTIADWPNEIRAEIDRLGLDDCKVIHVSRP